MRLLFSSALLGLAWFAAVNLVLSGVAWLSAGALANRVRSARGLLVLRLLPASASAAFVAAVFLPAHWRFEPAASDERFGVILAGLAALGGGLLARSAWRAIALAWRDYRIGALAQRVAAPIGKDAFEVAGLAGVSLAGILRPRILVGAEARAALTPAELDLAISHEIAHQRSRDNLKRFLIFCAPDLFGWSRAAQRLEERWLAESECQADALAVRGDDGRAVTLASALVKVARLGRRRDAILPSPAWSAFEVANLLETRVRRLVGGPVEALPDVGRVWAAIAAAAVTVFTAVALSDLAYGLHAVTESLVSRLP